MRSAGRTSDATAFWDDRHTRTGPVPEPHLRRGHGPLDAAAAFFGDVDGRMVLDLGCGNGRATLFFADCGAQVVAIDTSQVAVDDLRARCAERGVTTVDAQVRSAFDLADLPPVDFVYGSMILHHLEPFDEFVEQLHAVLSAGGRAFFHENNARSRVLIWFRQRVVGRLWVPKRGDDDEFPLTVAEVDLLRRRFRVRVEYPTLLLFRLVSDYLLGGHVRRPLAWLDRMLYRFPSIRRYSYRQFLYLRTTALRTATSTAGGCAGSVRD